jgi:predicted 2-oxoglutarate/Fe(II)-dependent dioxygenase YbiX
MSALGHERSCPLCVKSRHSSSGKTATLFTRLGVPLIELAWISKTVTAKYWYVQKYAASQNARTVYRMNFQKIDNAILYVHSAGPFTETELNAIQESGDKLEMKKAPLGADAEGGAYDHKRITRVGSIDHSPENAWIYDRTGAAAAALNRFYQFELSGFTEQFQYLAYDGEKRSHFDWHVDQNPFAVPRKLSLTLQLTDPSECEGCDLQFFAGQNVETAPRARGTLVAFPSYVLHRVTPIVSGARKAIVAWVSGPQFK